MGRSRGRAVGSCVNGGRSGGCVGCAYMCGCGWVRVLGVVGRGCMWCDVIKVAGVILLGGWGIVARFGWVVGEYRVVKVE